MSTHHRYASHRLRASCASGGFTLIELLVASAIAMTLLFGALFSMMETIAVVEQGDSRITTQIHARRALERLVKDCRYASDLTITGDEVDGWEIELVTGVNDDEFTWVWDPATQQLTISDGTSTESIVEGLQEFTIDTTLNGVNISQVVMVWTVAQQAGIDSADSGQATTATFPGSTWIRRYVD